MRKEARITLLILVLLLSGILFISKLYDKKPVSDVYNEDISTNEIETSTSSTNTTKTTKTSKKTVKTTKKTTKRVTTQKVVTGSKQEYINYAKSYGNLNDTQTNCLIYLWDHESGWNPNSVNKSSGACGIPQAYPCNKIKKQQGSNDWKAQIRWGLNYINSRYKNPCSAWNHFKNKHWY